MCEQLVEECLRNWRGGDWGDRGGCSSFLLGDGEAQQIRGRALLTVLEDLESEGTPAVHGDGDLERALDALYRESSAICDLVDNGAAATATSSASSIASGIGSAVRNGQSSNKCR